MASLSQWVGGARPRTLPTAVAAVAVGTGLAVNASTLVPVRALLALLVAVGLQIGVNYANDYSDGIKGTDEARVGPVRLVGQRLASPASVRLAALGSFAVAAALGVILVAIVGQWWLLLIGVACVAAAWLYTGGPRPYGYHGLGEVFVFVFFGLVPVVGTFYVQSLTVTGASVVASVGVGLLACAVLVTNNLRDIPTDLASGKRTLAVRLGDARTRHLYFALIAGAAAATTAVSALISWWLLVVLIALFLAVPPVRLVRGGATGPALVPALKGTGLLVLGYGLALAAGLCLV
jgi:1,4-dihydroxy-2-naphthoate octaprenyltransferase